jgi:pyruvate dehydrogenase E2 component (dihydrolipoamide acetyltransferase)
VPGRVYATPLARRRAAELHVNLDEVIPAEGHRIVVEDVIRAAATRDEGRRTLSSSPASPSPASPSPFSSLPSASSEGTGEDARRAMRRAIAATMAKSKREIPHYYLWTTVDAEPSLSWLDATNARRGVDERLLLAPLLVRAVAEAAATFSDMNGHWRDETFIALDDVHVGFATTLRGGGLVAPAIERADALSLDELMRAIESVVRRARSGRLTARELTSGTITVTSIGDVGIDGMLPVIVSPQVAIVGFGSVQSRAHVVNERVVVGRAFTVSLAADHRVSDGHGGARFLQAIEHRLLHPEEP